MSPVSRPSPRAQQARAGWARVQQRQTAHQRRFGDHQVPGDKTAKAVPDKVDRLAVADGADHLTKIACEQRDGIVTIAIGAGRFVLATLVVSDHPVTCRGDRRQQRDEIFLRPRETRQQDGNTTDGRRTRRRSLQRSQPAIFDAERPPTRDPWQPNRVGHPQRDPRIDAPSTAARRPCF